MPAYLLVLGKGTDRDRMAAYSRALPPVYAKAGGRYLAIGGPGRGVDWLAGPWRDRSLVLARFETLDRVLDFWWGDDYRAAARLRERGGQFTVVALPGLDDDAGRDAPAGAVYLVEATITREVEPGAASRDGATDAAARDALDAAAAAHGGRALVRTEAAAFTALEGDPLYDRVAVTYFPSAAACDAFLADPRSADASALRDGAGLAMLARASAAAAAPMSPAASAAQAASATSSTPSRR